MFEEISCALSGQVPTDDALMNAEEGIPEGWIRVTVERRFPNPKWYAIQNVKQGLMEATLAQIPTGERNAHRMNVALQVEAQYAMLEANTEQSFLESDTVYIAPPESDPALQAEYHSLLETLDIELEEEEEEEEEILTPEIEEEKVEKEEVQEN